MKRPWMLPTETWEVPATPTVPLDKVEDRVLLHLARTWGKLGHVAMCKFVSVLPEINRRSLFRQAGCSSIYELASKLGGLSRDVVDAVLRLHSYIGRYDCLWGLLTDGIVGWSKLSKIEDLVTPETAGWFARFVQEAPKSLVERIAARARARLRLLSGDPARVVGAQARDSYLTVALLEDARREASASTDPSRAEAVGPRADGHGAESAEPVGGSVGGGHPGGPASAVSEGAATSLASAASGKAAGRESAALVAGFLAGEGPIGEDAGNDSKMLGEKVAGAGSPAALEVEAGAGSPAARKLEAGVGSPAARELEAGAGSPAAREMEAGAGSPAAREMEAGAGSPADPDWTDLGGDFRPAESKRTSLELSPLCREVGERLLAEYRRRGLTVSLGQLVELAFRAVWASGQLPLPDDVDRAAAATLSSADAHPIEQFGGNAVPLPAPEPTPQPTPQSEAAPSAGPGIEARPRRLPISQHKVLAVVISVAETGETWMRTLGGIIPVRLADLSGLAPVVEIVPLAKVHRRLELKAAKSRGKGILRDTSLFVAATSGLHCQASGCDRPVAHVHHGKPRAEGPDHGPANTFGVCESCHAARHRGLILNPDAHPADWVLVAPSERPDPSRVDRACQALRQKALAAGFQVA